MSNRPQTGGGEPPERRRTFKPQVTFDSLRRRGTGASAQSTTKGKEKGPFQEHFACYDGLTWEALKGYLQGKWPHVRLEERRELDQWLFEIPERLTDEDKNEIAALRDRNNAPVRRRQKTPE